MKTGRPEKKENKRNITKLIRYSQNEWDAVQAKVTESGLTYSEYMRRVSIKGDIVIMSSETDEILNEIRTNLARIGANINMIARNSANILSGNDMYNYLSELENSGALARELKQEIDKFKDSLK